MAWQDLIPCMPCIVYTQSRNTAGNKMLTISSEEWISEKNRPLAEFSSTVLKGNDNLNFSTHLAKNWAQLQHCVIFGHVCCSVI